MTIFGILCAINAVAAFIALARLRPCAFIFSASQTLVLRALSNISYYGRPVSQIYVPESVFDDEHLRVAAILFAISTLMLLGTLALPGGKRPSTPPRLPALPRWTLGLIVVYLIVFFLSQKTILTTAYTAPEQTNFSFGFGGVHALILSVLLYEMYRRVAAGALSPWRAFAVVVAVLVATSYLKGSTGLATGMVVTAVVMILGSERRRSSRWLAIGGALVTAFLTAALVRAVRGSYSSSGTQALTDFQNTVLQTESETAQTGEGLENQGGADQNASHVLECISIYDRGVSRDWRSIYDPLIYTFEPSFLLNTLGIERPKEAAWEMAYYFISGGGIYYLGEFYWNGGYLCAVLVTLGLLVFMYFCDTRYRRGFAWAMIACQFAPSFLEGLGYGFAQISRGFFNALWVFSAYGLFLWVRRIRHIGGEPPPLVELRERRPGPDRKAPTQPQPYGSTK
jgi:hypothetical protein